MIHKSQKVETNQVSVNTWINKQNVVYPYNETLICHKKGIKFWYTLQYVWTLKMCVHAKLLSRVRLFVILWTVAHQAPLSMEFSRQEYCSGSPFPSPGDLPDPGIEPASLTSPALASGFFTTSSTWEAQKHWTKWQKTDIKAQIMSDFTYMKYLGKKKFKRKYIRGYRDYGKWKVGISHLMFRVIKILGNRKW